LAEVTSRLLQHQFTVFYIYVPSSPAVCHASAQAHPTMIHHLTSIM